MTMKKFLLKIKNDKALNIFPIHYLVLILKKNGVLEEFIYKT